MRNRYFLNAFYATAAPMAAVVDGIRRRDTVASDAIRRFLSRPRSGCINQAAPRSPRPARMGAASSNSSGCQRRGADTSELYAMQLVNRGRAIRLHL